MIGRSTGRLTLQSDAKHARSRGSRANHPLRARWSCNTWNAPAGHRPAPKRANDTGDPTTQGRSCLKLDGFTRGWRIRFDSTGMIGRQRELAACKRPGTAKRRGKPNLRTGAAILVCSHSWSELFRIKLGIDDSMMNRTICLLTVYLTGDAPPAGTGTDLTSSCEPLSHPSNMGAETRRVSFLHSRPPRVRDQQAGSVWGVRQHNSRLGVRQLRRMTIWKDLWSCWVDGLKLIDQHVINLILLL
ncbi:hypothetical protein BJX64DRAFT_120358 [Aspergillus heterothallicus]